MRRVIPLLLIIATLFAFVPAVQAQTDLQYIGSTVYVHESIETATINALIGANVDRSLYYAITDVSDIGDFRYYVSVIGVTQPDWRMDDAAYFATVYAWFEDGQMRAEVMQRDGDALVAQHGLDVHVLGTGDVTVLDYWLMQSDQQPEAESDINVQTIPFPWSRGYKMKYGVLGVHDAGVTSLPGWIAIDFVSTTDTPPEGADVTRLVTAVDDHRVEWVCRDATSMMVKTEFYVYAHLEHSGLQPGDLISEGEGFALLVPGTFDDNCGYATQGNDTWHLHFAFQPTRLVQFDNCVLDTDVSSNPFQCAVGEVVTDYDPGDWLTATGDPLPGTGVNYEGADTFWDWLVAGIVGIAQGAATALLGDQESSSLVSSMVTIAMTFVRLTWVLFVANFDPLIPMVVFSAIGMLEVIRNGIALYRMILKLIPGAS